MRPPDQLNSLKWTPLAMAGTGVLVLPAMWAFSLPLSTVLGMAPFSGGLLFAFGLHMTYRSRFSPAEAVWGVCVGVLFFGSFLIASTTSLPWEAQRPDLIGFAVAVAIATGALSILLGFLAEKRRLRDEVDGIPVVLMPLIDLQKHQIRPMPTPHPAPALGRIAFLTALAMNLPLLLQLQGFRRSSVLWVLMPLLFATITYILATGMGPAMARIQSLKAIERRTGHRFTTSRLDELTAMRRGLWLARWLCRDEDLAPSRR
jgi:hypothetical protein